MLATAILNSMPRPHIRVRWLAAGLLLVLSACAARQDDRVAALEARLERLESEVRRLRTELNELHGQDAARITDLAGARTCALEVARALEAYRSDNGRYPRASEVTFPGSCAGLRVNWRALQAGRYAFDVLGEGGQLLTREESE